MSKFEKCLAGKLYTIRKQYPVIKEFECRIREVERELNSGHTKKSMCDNQRKPMHGNVCKNRPMR